MADVMRPKSAGSVADETGDDVKSKLKAISFSTVTSAFALVFSVYSLWSTSLKHPDLRVFVPPVIHYSSPYQNNNFEMISIPVTLANEGARTGTVLAINLEVTDPRTNETKRFYAADFGRWTMERTRSGAYQPFAPISMAGRSSRTETVLFYTRGEQEKPNQLIRELGLYRFKLTIEEAVVEDFGWFDRLLRRAGAELSFERELKYYDARAFHNGTIPLYAKDWRSSVSGGQ